MAILTASSSEKHADIIALVSWDVAVAASVVVTRVL
jgi:hypothetical protein